MPSVSASGFVTDADPAFKFVMFIMGSGGHTTEMLSMIERSIWPAFGMYRRYVVNEGDRMSYQRVVTLETRMGEVFAAQGLNPGLFDIVEVKRARRVHQGWLTTPLSAALSLVSIVRIILAAGTEEGVRGVVVYMLIYLAMTLGGFAVLLAMRRKNQSFIMREIWRFLEANQMMRIGICFIQPTDVQMLNH